MAEYIEREKVIEELNNIAIDYIKDNTIQCSIAAGVVVNIKDTVITKQPTADVVEVVRCKDCKYQEDCARQMVHTTRDYILEVNVSTYNKVDYCSYGERKCEDGKV